jgi:small neutral amino acid transporter SnatA (MarC family)
MKLFHKLLDERQEQETMRIERGAFYVIFFALAISILVQLMVFNLDITHIAGEIIVLFMGAAWALAGYIRRGIWDNFTKPGIKSYLIYSTAVDASSHPI